MFFGLNDVAFLGSLQPPAPLLLDLYPNAAAAYSLRQLRIGVTNVVRVRRSSDNTEADFTAAQVSDGSLAAWVGAGNNGFVRTWYDQSGNGRHATQATTANQPQIVSSGNIAVENLKPCLIFDGTFVLSAVIPLVQPLSVCGVYKASASNSPVTGASAISVGAVISRRASDEYIIFAGSAVASGTHPSTQVLANAVFSGSSSIARWNGQQILSGNPGTGSTIDLIGGNTTARLTGTMQEIIIFDTDERTNFQAIESNINAHYAIYP
jgi:hypothetical protein